jgi:class 3 adenylate cyclase
MTEKFPYDLLEDALELSSFQGWSEDVYHDFLAFQRGAVSKEEFHEKYTWQRAILSLDMTGFTSSAMHVGELESFLRIVDMQKVCIPVLQEFNADLVRCFADDIVALFEDPHAAIDAAFEIHRRVVRFRDSPHANSHTSQCCVGIGYGSVFAIGPNLAQGDEMNRASKLGEDIARANETLSTERALESLNQRDDIRFELQSEDDQLFSFYRAVPAS